MEEHLRPVALILAAVLILGGCGGAGGGNSGASATTGGSTISSATATRAAAAAAEGGSYCREWQARSPRINRLAMGAATGQQPADVKAALDGLDTERGALGAAAPDELKGEAVAVFVTLRGAETSEQLRKELIKHVRN